MSENGSPEIINVKPSYNHFRNDVFRAIPRSAKTILSVGCSAGVTEAELVQRGIRVIGIEYDKKAAELARTRGIEVLQGDAESIDISKTCDAFDCLIYADVLEHLCDPEKLLKTHVRHLNPGGLVYVSVPNFRHYWVLWQLFIRGRIDYVDAGILDRTHIRMTTRKMVRQWFVACGLDHIQTTYIMHWRRHRWMSAATLGLAREFIAVQIGLMAEKPTLTVSGEK